MLITEMPPLLPINRRQGEGCGKPVKDQREIWEREGLRVESLIKLEVNSLSRPRRKIDKEREGLSSDPVLQS